MRSLALILMLTVAGCSGGNAPVPAKPHADTSTSTSVGGVTLQASTVAIADLNAAVAQRYGIDHAQDGVLLLVTVRDAAGNAAEPGDLQLAATAGSLTDSPQPLQLRSIQTAGMTDYIGVFHAAPPASLRFKLTATRGGARAEIATTAELQPR